MLKEITQRQEQTVFFFCLFFTLSFLQLNQCLLKICKNPSRLVHASESILNWEIQIFGEKTTHCFMAAGRHCSFIFEAHCSRLLSQHGAGKLVSLNFLLPTHHFDGFHHMAAFKWTVHCKYLIYFSSLCFFFYVLQRIREWASTFQVSVPSTIWGEERLRDNREC